MKLQLVFVLLLFSTFVTAQRLDFSLGLGSGRVYFIESIDNSVNVNYGIPLILFSEVKFTPKERSAGLKLRVQNFQSTIKGEDWTNIKSLYGEVNNFNASLLLENEFVNQKYSWGYNFGFGISREYLKPSINNNNDIRILHYPTASLGGIFTLAISKNSAIQIQPVILCTDPFNGFMYLTTNSATIAREDISGFVTLGFTYNLLKN